MRAISWLRILVVGVVFLQGCDGLIGSIGCGELESESTFDSRELMADHRTVLFTAHKRYFYSAEYCGTQTQQAASLGRWLLGTYDIYSNQVNILRRFQKGDRQWGIQSVAGSKVLMRSDSYFFLNFPSNQLIPVPLENEFVQKGLLREEVAPTPLLIDEEGNLLIIVLGDRTTQNVYEYWVRHNNGEYRRLDTSVRPIYRDGSVYWWSFATRRPLAYSLKTRTLRQITDKQYQGLSQQKNSSEPNVYIQHPMHPNSRLEIGYRQGKEWRYERLPIAAEDLAW